MNAGTANIRRVANSQASAINDGTTCIGIDFIPPTPTTTTAPTTATTLDPTTPDPTEPDPTPELFTPEPTEPDPAPDPTPEPTGPDPIGLVEEGEIPTSTTTTLDVDEEVTSQALSKVETEDDEGSFPTVGLAAILAGLAAAAGLALTSVGQLIRKRITGFLAGSILAFLILGRKRNRCEHCNKLVTSKEGILVDEDDNYECEENPDGDHHQLEEK